MARRAPDGADRRGDGCLRLGRPLGRPEVPEPEGAATGGAVIYRRLDAPHYIPLVVLHTERNRRRLNDSTAHGYCRKVPFWALVVLSTIQGNSQAIRHGRWSHSDAA